MQVNIKYTVLNPENSTYDRFSTSNKTIAEHYLLKNILYELQIMFHHNVTVSVQNLLSTKWKLITEYGNTNYPIVSNIETFDCEKMSWISSDNSVRNALLSDSQQNSILLMIQNFINMLSSKTPKKQQVSKKQQVMVNKKYQNTGTSQMRNMSSPLPTIEKEEIIVNENKDEIEPLDEETILAELEQLKQKYNEQESELETLKEHKETIENKFSETLNDVHNEKRKIRHDLDREREKYNIFKANKRTYFMLKKEMMEGTRKKDLVPELFQKEYPIFQIMDEENMLSDDDEYDNYTLLLEEVNKMDNSNDNNDNNNDESKEQYIPHNYHYLPEDEKKRYMMEQNKNDEKEIPSYDELMKKLDLSSDDECPEDLVTDNHTYDIHKEQECGYNSEESDIPLAMFN